VDSAILSDGALIRRAPSRGRGDADTQIDSPEQQGKHEIVSRIGQDVRQPFHPHEDAQQNHDLRGKSCFRESHQFSFAGFYLAAGVSGGIASPAAKSLNATPVETGSLPTKLVPTTVIVSFTHMTSDERAQLIEDY
jgi:hypothetical protein